MKLPLIFRVFGYLRNVIDNYTFSEVLLKRMKKEDVFFIQIGANDGVSQDPIYKYSSKWRGILIEPLEVPFSALKKNYSMRAEGKVFENSAIGKYNGSVEIFCPEQGEWNKSFATKISSLKDTSLLGLYETHAVSVNQLTFSTLLEKYEVEKIDLLVLDVEGYELEILMDYDFRVKPTVIFMETRFFNYHELTIFYSKMIGLGYRIYPERDNCLLVLKK
jgi:FkbM family methyltransferase